MPSQLTLARAALLLGLTLVSGCALFEDIDDPATLGADAGAVLSCERAPCDAPGAARCRANTLDVCTQTPACTLWQAARRCDGGPGLTPEAPVALGPGETHHARWRDALYVARGAELVRLDAANTQTRVTLDAPVVGLAPTPAALIAVLSDGAVLALDETLATRAARAPVSLTAGSFALITRGDEVLIGSGQALYGLLGEPIMLGADVRVEALSLPDAAADEVFVASRYNLLRVVLSSGEVTRTTLEEPISAIAADAQGVWVASLRALTHHPKAALASPDFARADALCGNATDLRVLGDALWMADAGGCLQRLPLSAGAIDTARVQLGTTPNPGQIRPATPLIAQGLAYALSRTREIIVFDPTTLQELGRVAQTGDAPMGPLLIGPGDKLALLDASALRALSPACPCAE